MNDPFDLERFRAAQAVAYEAALAELRAARSGATGSGSCSRRWPGSG